MGKMIKNYKNVSIIIDISLYHSISNILNINCQAW